ncbi:hypothetical protein [Bradyrhizobium sp. AZCC 2289]|uniref:hypothetical protein n=1 Tax=Bradyrhizobium sp. AZCC 2289 TaxID=3117026 RepID=UPI002FF3DBFA
MHGTEIQSLTGEEMGRSVYKFLHSRDVGSMMSGNVVIRPLSYYRRLEEQGAAPWIGDRLENISEVYVDHVSDKTPELLNRIGPEGMPPGLSPMDGAKDWSASDVTFQYQFANDPWVFCASDGDLKELTKVMCGGDSNYDACVRIKDFGKFTAHLYFQGRIKLNPVADFFKASHAGRVKYDHVALKIQEGRPPVPGPFLKDVKFLSQQEGRYALFPSNPIGEDILFINFSSASEHLVQEF